MSRVIHRHLHKSYPSAARSSGITITDVDGRQYIDASGGAAVSCLGHAHPDVLAAMHHQIDELAYAHTSFFTTDVAEELADHLVSHAPDGLGHVYFVSGGSEAVEAALKMARQYFVEIGQPQRRQFVARRQSYHGNTLGALAVGGNVWRRQQFAPLLIDVTHVAPCYEYRDRLEHETAQQYGVRLALELEETLHKLGPQTVIAFVAETVGGATAGVLAPVPGYLQRVREVCDRHGVLLMLDEVMCGMGRTGFLHACQEDGVCPDLLVIAKGLGGGYQPIGAVLAANKIVDAFSRGTGFFQHGHTYLGHPVACAAALAVQKVIQRDRLLENVVKQGEYLQAQLQRAFGEHPHVGDIRGRGLFRAIELVANRSLKTAFDPARNVHARIKQNAMERGLMVYPMGGTIDGKHGDHVLIAPPFIVKPHEIDAIVERLSAALDASIASSA